MPKNASIKNLILTSKKMSIFFVVVVTLLAAARSSAAATDPAPSPCTLLIESKCTFLFGDACTACVKQNNFVQCSAEILERACATTVTATTSTVQLSTARRNIGAVAYRGKAYFAGGCIIEGGNVQFVCDKASAVVDVFALQNTTSSTTSAATTPTLVRGAPLMLAEARGWVAASAVDNYVVFVSGRTCCGLMHCLRIRIPG